MRTDAVLARLLASSYLEIVPAPGIAERLSLLQALLDKQEYATYWCATTARPERS